MAWKLYIVPITRINYPDGTEFAAPSYFWGRETSGSLELQGVRWAWNPYIWENNGILAADVTDIQHAYLVGLTDVIAVPALDNTIPNATARNKVRNILEAGNIPGTWVNIGMTYRQVARTVLNIFAFHGRYVSKGGRVFVGGVNLNTTWSQLPALAQQRLIETAVEFGLDYSAIDDTTTIRQILKGLADQFGDITYQLGELVI